MVAVSRNVNNLSEESGRFVLGKFLPPADVGVQVDAVALDEDIRLGVARKNLPNAGDIRMRLASPVGFQCGAVLAERHDLRWKMS